MGSAGSHARRCWRNSRHATSGKRLVHFWSNHLAVSVDTLDMGRDLRPTVATLLHT